MAWRSGSLRKPVHDGSLSDTRQNVVRKLTVSPETLIERLLIALGVPPVTLMDTHMSFLRARSIMVATKIGVFDALVDAPRSAATIAERCGTVPGADRKTAQRPRPSSSIISTSEPIGR